MSYNFLNPVDLVNRTYPQCPTCPDATPENIFFVMFGFTMGLLLGISYLIWILKQRDHGSE